MSGTDRLDQQQVGLQETAAVKGVYVDADGARWNIEKERAVLRKFDGEFSDEWTPEEASAALAEVIVLEDGEIIDHWHRGEDRDAPS